MAKYIVYVYDYKFMCIHTKDLILKTFWTTPAFVVGYTVYHANGVKETRKCELQWQRRWTSFMWKCQRLNKFLQIRNKWKINWIQYKLTHTHTHPFELFIYVICGEETSKNSTFSISILIIFIFFFLIRFRTKITNANNNVGILFTIGHTVFRK